MKIMRSLRAALIGCAMLLLAVVSPVLLLADEAKLGALWSEMSDGDRAAMKAASIKAGATLQAIKGSPNAEFWRELSSRRLMRSVSMAELFGDQAEVFAKAGLVAFAVTPEGAETIPGIVEDLEKK